MLRNEAVSIVWPLAYCVFSRRCSAVKGQGEGPTESRVYILYFPHSLVLFGKSNGR